MALRAIHATLSELDKSVESREIIRISAPRPVNNLLELLVAEKAIKIISRNQSYMTVQPTSEVSCFIIINEASAVSFRELQYCALENTPTITARLIVSTSMGLMTQYSAIEQRLGGKIIGAFF